jgi:hypothetical protein
MFLTVVIVKRFFSIKIFRNPAFDEGRNGQIHQSTNHVEQPLTSREVAFLQVDTHFLENESN